MCMLCYLQQASSTGAQKQAGKQCTRAARRVIPTAAVDAGAPHLAAAAAVLGGGALAAGTALGEPPAAAAACGEPEPAAAAVGAAAGAAAGAAILAAAAAAVGEAAGEPSGLRLRLASRLMARDSCCQALSSGRDSWRKPSSPTKQTCGVAAVVQWWPFGCNRPGNRFAVENQRHALRMHHPLQVQQRAAARSEPPGWPPAPPTAPRGRRGPAKSPPARLPCPACPAAPAACAGGRRAPPPPPDEWCEARDMRLVCPGRGSAPWHRWPQPASAAARRTCSAARSAVGHE